ncbi:acyl-CoA dehydrogenase [Pseudorhodoferax sp.]|uniref:acyl-CoA dehydrogenase n=1 Tax=Pseudorhodoferax sp. TaxID=1993553 RepID=UPI002DD631C4|nr:acyl-CoA dehydrogenase [Pseudorhodoferax sp.]
MPAEEQQQDHAELLGRIDAAAAHYLEGRGGLAVARRQRNWPEGAPRVAEFGRADWQAMAGLGWTGVLVAETHGGTGLGLAAAARVARAVGQWLAPEPFTAVAGVAATLLAASDTPLAHALLRGIADGSRIVGTALGADADGTDAACTLDAATALHGQRRYATPADPVDGWLVPARDPQGRTAVAWVAAGAAGLGLQTQPSADGRLLAHLRLDGVPVAGAVLLQGDAATLALRHAVAVGRVLYAAELLGSAQALEQRTLAHLRTRRQFGQPLGAFQVLQHRCVDLRLQTELAQAGLQHAVDGAAAGLEPAAIRARLRAAHCALTAAQTAVQLHGAMGYADACDLGLYYRRTLAVMARLGSARTLARRWLAWSRADVQRQDSTPWQGDFPRTADWNAMPEHAFRAMLRAFLAQQHPPQLRHLPYRAGWREMMPWFQRLSRQGWAAPSWPQAHGGMGLSPARLLAWMEECEAFGAAAVPNQGPVMLAPVLMRHGTPEQQRRYLPAILRGEHIWCQGYSEPEAGSDLASLRTRAVLQDGRFTVNGQKIWTTNAHEATHIFLLVRTDPAARPQAGISFLLCDLRTPGITIRPIRTLAGQEEFCEVFFDDVQVPADQLVGRLHDGWQVAKALLGHERLNQGSPRMPQAALAQLRLLGDAAGLAGQADFDAVYAELALDVAGLVDLYGHYAGYVRRDDALPPSVSLLKLWGTETSQRIAAAILRFAGEHAGVAGAADVDGTPLHLAAPLWNATPATLYGGTSEVHRNILARAVLDLPGA